MSRKKLDIQEALQLFYDLPSDNESVDSENSCDEDYMPKPLEYTSDSDTASSEDEEINLSGSSQVTQMKWQWKKVVTKEIPAFLEEAGPSEEIILMEKLIMIN
ncbi:hypothetical protein NPIL_363421 [Nephila pilipes]|uniref:Uncharacterized protein n=1 Tax=Nephila pilipes TaxID=299642 RepID=A0A8X6QK90_NEPPI|nr:hypothetical protein NPIL_363421 [Nephila pilipes]